MKFVTTWTLRPDAHKNATTRFLENGATPPEGIKTIGRWHFTDGSGGLHVFECDDAQVLTNFAHEWGDLLELHTTPVVEDAEAGAAMAKRSGKP